jgi:hypothetical protein
MRRKRARLKRRKIQYTFCGVPVPSHVRIIPLGKPDKEGFQWCWLPSFHVTSERSDKTEGFLLAPKTAEGKENA